MWKRLSPDGHHMPPAQSGQPRSTDYWAFRTSQHFKHNLRQTKKSNEQWSCLTSVQCPANKIFLVIFYAYRNRYPIVHLWSNTATHKEQVLATAQSMGPTPQTRQNSFRSQSKFLAILSHTEWSLNFSPTSRDDPFKIGLSHVMRMGKLAKAINCDLSVSGIQAFSLLVYQFSTSARQSTCLKYKPTRGTFHCLLQVFSPTAAQM